MRRTRPARDPLPYLHAAFLALTLFLIATTASAQIVGPLHPQPPSADQSAPETNAEAPPLLESYALSALVDVIKLPIVWPEPQPSLPELPAQIAIPMDRAIPVVLDTPLSTRISRQGQAVTFRTKYSILLGDSLEVPPETEILGHVVEVQKPGHFAKQGELRVAIDRIHLDPDGGTSLVAHVDSAGMTGQGRRTTEKRHSTDLYSVLLDTAGGTIGGAKGAGIGAGAGAAAAVLIMMSHRGQDVYLEPGMPFSVIIEQPAYLSGAAVYAAQEKFRNNRRLSPVEPDSQDGLPKLKRRPPPQN